MTNVPVDNDEPAEPAIRESKKRVKDTLCPSTPSRERRHRSAKGVLRASGSKSKASPKDSPSSDSSSPRRAGSRQPKIKKKKKATIAQEAKDMVKDNGCAFSEHSSSEEAMSSPYSLRRSKSELHDLKAVQEEDKTLEDTDEFLQREAEVLDDFLKREEDDFVYDASCLVSELQKAYSKVSNGLGKPNVLLTGITGSGKSSIINAVFGKNVAKTAAGYPVTQHFTKYDSDDMRVVIYDSKGLEHGEFENFITTTQDFFNKHKISDGGESSDAIHVIWYIVNSAHSRWEPFEERICRELFNKAPLMFILNKADISSDEDRKRIRKVISNMDLPNCVGVFDTVAACSGVCQAIEECPRCGSDDLVIRKKTATAQCMNCDLSTCIQKTNGLADVIKTTCRVLPEVVRDAFISAQNVSFQLKECNSHHVIEEFWDEYSHVRTPAKLLRVIAKMMARLSIVWEFKQHGHVYGELLARNLVSHLKWKDRINLLFHKKTEQQRIHITALGILWNKCLRDLAVALFKEFTKRNKTTKCGKTTAINTDKCSKFFHRFFSQRLNEDNLLLVEDDIRHLGIKTLLENDTLDDLACSSSPFGSNGGPEL